MKKLLLLSFVACAMLSPLTLSAQKKKAAKAVAPVELILKSEADTTSYALGANIAQSGLRSYLLQMGVLADSAAVRTDYDSRIANESNEAQKTKLNSELKSKLDSLSKSNVKNLEDFLSGFNYSMKQSKEQGAYNNGIAIGSQLSSMIEKFSEEVLSDKSQFNFDAFIAAFTGGLKEEKLLIENSEEILQAVSMKAQEAKEAKMAEDAKSQYATQIAEGEKFMAENKAKEDVVTLPSGLQYKVLTEGAGEKPTASDRVKVHYTGTLLDGTVFDSSVDRGEPTTFGVGQVIKGWTEALQLMPVGSKWIVYIPYDLAYGSRDQGAIKPFSNLIFEVELLEIVKD